MDCALTGKADGTLGCDSPQNFGGAQAEVWHGAEGHPLIEDFPTEGREGLVNCSSCGLVSLWSLRVVDTAEWLDHC